MDIHVAELRIELRSAFFENSDGLEVVTAYGYLLFRIELNCSKETVPPKDFFGRIR